MRFNAGKTKELLWPNIAGVAAAIGGHYLSRGIDHSQEWTTPWKRSQDYWAVGSALAAWYMYCSDIWPAFNDSWFDANLTLIGEGIADKVFGPPEELFKGRVRQRVRSREQIGEATAGQLATEEAEELLRRHRRGGI